MGDWRIAPIPSDLNEVPSNTSALRAMAATYNREIGVFSNVAVVCRPSRKEAEEYFRYYAVANADRDAVENMIVGRGLKNPAYGRKAPDVTRTRGRWQQGITDSRRSRRCRYYDEALVRVWNLGSCHGIHELPGAFPVFP
jgi:alkanesulfonate monooxygenase SsuD/methylene tetrahydromethanopterin reductase-like flavin-dependent oxidoreductase (luciferase family)